jgi:hypothetical protein
MIARQSMHSRAFPRTASSLARVLTQILSLLLLVPTSQHWTSSYRGMHEDFSKKSMRTKQMGLLEMPSQLNQCQWQKFMPKTSMMASQEMPCPAMATVYSNNLFVSTRTLDLRQLVMETTIGSFSTCSFGALYTLGPARAVHCVNTFASIIHTMQQRLLPTLPGTTTLQLKCSIMILYSV